MSLADTTTSTTTDFHRSLTAFFDTRDAAEKAERDLIASGIPADDIRIAGGATQGSSAVVAEDKGFWESLKDFFLPEEDRYAYAEGLRRGGYALSVRTDDASYERAAKILDTEAAVDLDSRETTWRSEGWSGYRAGQTYGAADAGLAAPRATGASLGASGATATATTLDATGEEVIPVYEEQLRVGKRDVAGGRVRLRSYVVETPVNEQVTLRQERVDIERRPVDRAVSATDAVFQDRTIEARAYAEEAVVEKTVRVKEEIGIRKTAEQVSQTVTDSVRRTEVEVEDERGQKSAGGVAGADYARQIVSRMDVIASDGQKIGTVDHLEGNDRIKLAKTTSPDGQHHTIPLSWVGRVDTHVHLNKSSADAKAAW